MNVQQHARIARIKQFSRYLYGALTGVRYLLWVTWPLAVVLALVVDKGHFTLGSATFNEVEVTFLQRILLVAYLSAVAVLLLKLTHHFRALIRSFAEGDIFNKGAIGHARNALGYGMATYGLYLGASLVGWVYNLIQHSPASIAVNGDFLVWLMFFGLMFVLLWALEIGCDLHEESELTI